MGALSISQAEELYATFRRRRERWTDESEPDAFLVAVLNFGMTAVACTAGEWTGTKAELAPRDGIPLCPNGHPLFEGRERLRLGLVPEGY